MQAWTPPRVEPQVIEYLREQLAAREAHHRLSPEQLENMYLLGLSWLRNEMIDRAHDMFIALRVYRPMDFRFLLGHAITLKMQKRYEDALGVFGAASMVEPDKPEPLMHAGECLLAIGHAKEAIGVMQRVLVLAANKPDEYKKFAERAEGWLALAQDHDPG
ncbi:tetratricopeptide repeat protein [Lacisediminimonas sp.]|uniref:tetratricopeptide repeat protein n=1 Tax=Lacisediminimonas sp. TaxID=3060582 RepID=UPI0027164B5C|nr:tetratricopeptide repeat protein [Lacisediminimonas sp.]MDO8300184.1 tetratricopeptide repeat protein [Lacisediminimonas sp.]